MLFPHFRKIGVATPKSDSGNHAAKIQLFRFETTWGYCFWTTTRREACWKHAILITPYKQRSCAVWGWRCVCMAACQRHATTRLAHCSVPSARHQSTAAATTPHCAPLRCAYVGLLGYRASGTKCSCYDSLKVEKDFTFHDWIS